MRTPRRWLGPEGSYTDEDGYVAIVRAYAMESRGTGPHGDGFIRHPDGTMVFAGHWMDWPEPEWMHGKVNLLEDYRKHRKAKTEHASVYRTKIPIEQRVQMEAFWQATAYEPLKAQFDYYITANNRSEKKEDNGPAHSSDAD